ncbi:putative GPI anchored protein [Aspergillus clavatus NRRL 1]|uniref:GPI anchored protein n=1 Tax=Aspergillus clavatus (strain ATCC 1007 / CBS 513.65 / DSM 816 / NCTC 3887 / NRRL 1 / QM 1276 / 107) TaxID=344612 RepID=A1C9D0_ASPCL|nr:uncharacterized protein ACLA_055010 [Aspergillus clavatus NRRL 1]EAW13454.1 hypothetical protein ACLA_055010 [Aspergillus clavatus NRRL 1]
MHLSTLLAFFTLHLSLIAATELSPPTLYDRYNNTSNLAKRASCGDGMSCLIGVCCGDGCAMNCCAMDNGGLGCGITERCQFKGNVFVGCCGNLIGGCTGEATRVTIHTPYSTVTLKPGTGNSIINTNEARTTSTEGVMTAISASETEMMSTPTSASASSATRRYTSATETAATTARARTTARSTTPTPTSTSTLTDGTGLGKTGTLGPADGIAGAGAGGFSQMPNGAGRVMGVLGMGMGMGVGVALGVLIVV